MRFFESRLSKNKRIKMCIFGCNKEELRLLLDICEKKRKDVTGIFELTKTKNRLSNFIREIIKALKEE